MINEITNIQDLEQVSGGATRSFRRLTITSNGTTTTTRSGGDSGERFLQAARARFAARRAAREAERASRPDRPTPGGSNSGGSSSGGGFPASAALGLP